MEDITIDELKGYGLRVAQPVNGYRFSLDPILLSSFACLKAGDRVADLGTGCGIIPLLLTSRAQNVTVVGVEFQEQMAELARRNISLNGIREGICILTEDVSNLKRHFPVSSFDLVISNPPYRKPGNGRISPKTGRDKARHESTATLADFVAMAKFLVKNVGRICFIYHVSRMAEFFAVAAALKLAPLRLRIVHDRFTSEGRMFMAELAKGSRGDLIIEAPLVVRDASGAYSPEVEKLMDGISERRGQC